MADIAVRETICATEHETIHIPQEAHKNDVSRRTTPIRHLSIDEEANAVLDEENVDTSRKHHHVVRHLSIDENSPLLYTASSEDAPTKSRLAQSWAWYQLKLERQPLITKSITACSLVGCGDLAGQSIEFGQHGSTQLDLGRFLRFALMGLVLQAPITHYFYLVLDAKLPPTPSPWTVTTFVKLAIDQLLFAPSFTVLIFLFLDVLQGDSLQQLWYHLQTDFVSTMLLNWQLWVPATFINLAFLPPELRVLYCNIVFFVWSIVLSLILNRHPSDEQQLNV
jgi:hypothetical protein